MKRSVKFQFSVLTMVVLLYPFSFSTAKEPDQTERNLDSTSISESSGDVSVVTEELPENLRWNEQDRYNRLLKEYTQSINEAQSDEERTRLRRAFEDETRGYTNTLNKEKKNLKQRDLEKQKQALSAQYQKDLRQLKRDHDQKVRRLETECRRDAFGVDTKNNKLELEPDKCQKRPLMEAEFKRRSKALEKEYSTNLQTLENN